MSTRSLNKWKHQDDSNAEYLGYIEFEDPRDPEEYIDFELLKTETHILFGGACNIGFLESGNKLIDDCFSIDENIAALIEDLENYYSGDLNQIPEEFTCNERM